jgi:hypothetical protein
MFHNIYFTTGRPSHLINVFAQHPDGWPGSECGFPWPFPITGYLIDGTPFRPCIPDISDLDPESQLLYSSKI